MKKNNGFILNASGITLIALVITIIILLILSGISISMLIGENGLIAKTIDARKTSKIEEEKEIINLAYMAQKTDYISERKIIDKNSLKSEIENSKKKVDIYNCDINGENIEKSEYVKITFLDTKNWYILNLETGRIEKYGINGQVIENEIKEGNIEIYNLDDLKKFQELVNNGATFDGYTVKLMNDIDLSPVCGKSIGNWSPIGNYNIKSTLYFGGVLEGNNHTISNLYINDINLSYQGLFGVVKNGKITNLNVKGLINAKTINGGIIGAIRESNEYSVEECTNNVNVTNVAGAVGGIIGRIENNSINTNIIKCINKGNIVSTSNIDYSVGGIVGTIIEQSSCVINECNNQGNVNCYYIGAGGIVGRIRTDVKNILIQKCDNIGKVNANRNAGGIIGRIDENTNKSYSINVENCKNAGEITAEVYNAGGIIGYAVNSNLINIKKCENDGIITAKISNAGGIIGGIGKDVECIVKIGVNNKNITAAEYNAGGIIGNIEKGGKVSVEHSSNLTGVTVEKFDNAGGIVGNANSKSTLKITKSYNMGDISSGRYSVGGILGLSYDSGTIVEINNSYNAGTINAKSASYGGIIGSIDMYSTATISYCHNVGILKESKRNKGAIVGYQNATYTGTNNYWLETCNTMYSVGNNNVIGNKYTKDQMKNKSNFNMWDFDTIWEINETEGYPILKQNSNDN